VGSNPAGRANNELNDTAPTDQWELLVFSHMIWQNLTFHFQIIRPNFWTSFTTDIFIRWSQLR